MNAFPPGLVVSVQAPAGSPLASPGHMAAIARAAEAGGAAAIRAEGAEDVAAIKRAVDLPVIGLRKRRVSGSEVYITPEAEDARAWWRRARTWWRSTPRCAYARGGRGCEF